MKREAKRDGGGTWTERAKAHIVRTNMFLPEGASVIGLVASDSLTVSFSGSLSPGFTWVGARSVATWAWAVWAAPFTRLATAEDILYESGYCGVWIVGARCPKCPIVQYIYLPMNMISHVEVKNCTVEIID